MLITSNATQNLAQSRDSSAVWSWLSSPTTFGWLLALAISSRVIYPEPIQLVLFVIFFIYTWSMVPLREGILASLATLRKLTEGKLIILLVACVLITTASAATREQQLTLGLNFILLLTGVLASCGCLSMLSQNNHSTRRIFRIVTACFTISTLMWVGFPLMVFFLYLQINFHGSTYLQSWFLYLLYSQAGVIILFVPLILAAFSKYGIGASTNGNSRLFWRVCISLGLLSFLLFSLLTERLIVALSLLVVTTVATVVTFDKKKISRILSSLVGVSILCLSILLLYYYLRENAAVYPGKSEICAECNELFLPWWLVDNTRQFSWRETITVWLENPWLGRGVHNDLSSFHHPHSRFLQILSGVGIVGFSVFAVLLGLLLVKNFLQWRKTRKLSSLSTLLVHSVYWSIGAFELSVWSVWHFWIYICAIVLSMSLDRLPLDKTSASAKA